MILVGLVNMKNNVVVVENKALENLVKVENDQVVVSSRNIAEHFEKAHKHVLEFTERLKAENSALT